MLSPYEECIGEECQVCENQSPESDMRKMYIDDEKTLVCKTCREKKEQDLKVVDCLVIYDALKEIVAIYGKDRNQFNLALAERLVEERNISLRIEKRGGKFNQERLGELVSLSNGELLKMLHCLKREFKGLWINQEMNEILKEQIMYTIPVEKQ